MQQWTFQGFTFYPVPLLIYSQNEQGEKGLKKWHASLPCQRIDVRLKSDNHVPVTLNRFVAIPTCHINEIKSAMPLIKCSLSRIKAGYSS